MEKTISDKADKLHNNGFNCSESVLLLVVDEWKVTSPLIPRIATGFGGGMGRQGHVCGALSGGVIALSIKYGRDSGSDKEARNKTYTLVRELFNRFSEEFGCVNCLELTGCDLTTPEGAEKLQRLRTEKCARYIARTAEIVLDLTKL